MVQSGKIGERTGSIRHRCKRKWFSDDIMILQFQYYVHLFEDEKQVSTTKVWLDATTCEYKKWLNKRG